MKPSSKQMAEAWRRAATVLERRYLDAGEMLFVGDLNAVEKHIMSTIVPSLRRRAEIIERRSTHAKRKA